MYIPAAWSGEFPTNLIPSKKELGLRLKLTSNFFQYSIYTPWWQLPEHKKSLACVYARPRVANNYFRMIKVKILIIIFILANNIIIFYSTSSRWRSVHCCCCSLQHYTLQPPKRHSLTAVSSWILLFQIRVKNYHPLSARCVATASTGVTINNVNVSGCTERVCVLQRGTNVSAHITFTPSKSPFSSHVSISKYTYWTDLCCVVFLLKSF